MPQTKTTQNAGKTVEVREPRNQDGNRVRPFGSVAHTEIVSRNPQQTRDFYEAVFGWTFEETRMDDGPYLSATTPGGRESGIRPAVAGELRIVTSYIRVEDLVEAEALIEEHGGEIIQARTEVPNRGSFILFEAPGGPIMGIWQDSNE